MLDVGCSVFPRFMESLNDARITHRAREATPDPSAVLPLFLEDQGWVGSWQRSGSGTIPAMCGLNRSSDQNVNDKTNSFLAGFRRWRKPVQRKVPLPQNGVNIPR